MAIDFLTLPQHVAEMKAEPAGAARGKSLEELVRELFSALPGVDVADRNVLAGSGEAELDILLSNTQREDGLPAFGRDVIIECKSSDIALGSAGVNHFISQVSRRQIPWSIIVSLAGLTGDENEARAAHHEIGRAAEKGTRVLLFVENELQGIRSAEHLAAVIEHKRRKLVGKLRAVTLTDEEMRELDPNKGAVQFTRGLAGIEQAIRASQERALNEMFDEAVELPDLGEDDDTVFERTVNALQGLNAELEDHRENPDEDPMWRGVRDRVVALGAAFAALLEEDLTQTENRRIVSFDVRTSAPQQLDAHAGGELWDLLTAYRLRQLQEHKGHQRRRSVMAMLAMCVEEIIAIDDIDPGDVYDDYEPDS